MNVSLTTRILTNKTLLKGLEKISEHGTSFQAGTSLVMSLGIRPLAIFATPDTEKENKQYAASNSICSGLMKFAIVEAVALPIENAVKNIDKNPEKFLKKFSIDNLKGGADNLAKSKSYNLITQMIKLSVGFFTAIPKSMLTIALIPIVMDKLFNNRPKSKQEDMQIANSDYNFMRPDSNVFFTGKISERVSKGLGKLIDNKKLQNFAIKYQDKDKDISKHITAATDVLLTSTSVIQTNRSEKIKQNRKKALIYNNIISTTITLVGGYAIDGLIKKPSQKFIDKFSKLNAGNPKLAKYIAGINILRPALIFASIYYGILPMFSTYLAEKIDKYLEKK